MSIKYIQEQLGVTTDGIWGSRSQAALLDALEKGETVRLSQHFTINEFIYSDTANEKHIKNLPPAWAVPNMAEFVDNLLEPIRSILGTPMKITSGYRTTTLNKLVRGSSTSVHPYGWAADFRSAQFGTPGKIVDYLTVELKKRGLSYDQLIIENRGQPNSWVHIGYKNRAGAMRQKNLSINT